MVGWHHQLNGHEFQKTPGDGEGQESLVCCSPWDCKNNNKCMPMHSRVLQKTCILQDFYSRKNGDI